MILSYGEKSRIMMLFSILCKANIGGFPHEARVKTSFSAASLRRAPACHKKPDRRMKHGSKDIGRIGWPKSSPRPGRRASPSPPPSTLRCASTAGPGPDSVAVSRKTADSTSSWPASCSPPGSRRVCQVLAHEILHTCRGCANHGLRWKDYAQRMNELYGYGVERTDSFEKLGAGGPAPGEIPGGLPELRPASCPA